MVGARPRNFLKEEEAEGAGAGLVGTSLGCCARASLAAAARATTSRLSRDSLVAASSWEVSSFTSTSPTGSAGAVTSCSSSDGLLPSASGWARESAVQTTNVIKCDHIKIELWVYGLRTFAAGALFFGGLPRPRLAGGSDPGAAASPSDCPPIDLRFAGVVACWTSPRSEASFARCASSALLGRPRFLTEPVAGADVVGLSAPFDAAAGFGFISRVFAGVAGP